MPAKLPLSSPRQFLRYWKPDAVDATVEQGGVFGHSAGNQHERNRSGDVIWLVTVRDGDMQLVGRMTVWKVMSWDEVVRHFRRDDFWDAEFHVVAKRGSEEPFACHSVTDIASRLRFVSPTGRDQLLVISGRVPAQQLQTMRLLTEESAALLNRIWKSATEVLPASANELPRQFKGAGFGDAENNREVEVAAENAVIGFYKKIGWTVQSVGSEGRGFDLHCVHRDGREHHVEVKGISGNEESFIIYRTGLRLAENDPNFRLFTVTNALSDERRCLMSYTGKELLKKFDFEPKDFFAAKRSG